MTRQLITTALTAFVLLIAGCGDDEAGLEPEIEETEDLDSPTAEPDAELQDDTRPPESQPFEQEELEREEAAEEEEGEAIPIPGSIQEEGDP